MPKVICTPILSGQRREDLASEQESTQPSALGIIGHVVHVAMDNVRKTGVACSCPDTSFELKFTGGLPWER